MSNSLAGSVGRVVGPRPLFVAGLVACLGSGAVPHGPMHDVLTYAGAGLSLVTGPLVARVEPVKSWLAARPVLWFLCLFNGAAAGFAALFLHGMQAITAAAGMGVVSAVSAVRLLLARRIAAH
ncbi:hypothetical protein [Nocardia sp. alder85J]|uniref:hypothetical protein n=1 Tax=Nocardia sp. alder85J TaxID=2862949 RepID=UPI001CD7C20A|nr:hypothetical protein [Nocardia sp. alder85J]MCX4091039.1 hypothetical protein [Nocardia sp. alder85J]